MSYGTVQANAIQGSINTFSPNSAVFRNRIINGAMVIDQRNAGASVTPTNGQYLVDRWYAGLTQASKYTVQQDAGAVTPPTGFTDYLGVTSSSAYSILASDAFFIAQAIEGFNVADLGWGTANARTVTLSFWVRSSLTGTFGGALRNSANNRSYPFSYTISSSNTWEQKSITVAGDTSGTWLTNNGVGISLFFGLGVGSNFSGTAGAWNGNLNTSATGATSVVGTNGATFYITGVQLEVGSTATSFDYRPYGTEFQLCQRYFYKNICTTGGSANTPLVPMGWSYNTTNIYIPVIFPVPMRGTPTFSRNGCRTYNPTLGSINITAASIADASNISTNVDFAVSSGLTANYGYWVSPITVSTDFIAFSAEL